MDNTAHSTASSNSRIARIRKFCMAPPRRAATLRLLTCDDPPQRLGEWEKGDCVDNETLPPLIDETLIEHRDEMETEVSAHLVWFDAEDKPMVSKKLNCRMPPGSVELEALGLTGNDRGMAMQAQQHLHLQTKLHYNAMNSLVSLQRSITQDLRDIIRDQAEMLREAYGQKHALHERLGEYAEGMEQQTEQAGDPVAEAQAGLIDAITDGVKQFAPVVGLKLMQGAGGSE